VPPAIGWNHPNSEGEKIQNVVNVGNWYYSTISDDQNGKTGCDFWREFSSAVTISGGYSPPGVPLVKQSFVSATGDPSARYVGGNTN
jgi:hypothetical protein